MKQVRCREPLPLAVIEAARAGDAGAVEQVLRYYNGFVTWNFAVKVLGAVKTSVYIYMVPVITVVTSVLILHEKITVLAGVGTLLTLAGLFLSESKAQLRKEDKNGLTK